ncbi:MAG: hypothetical protein ACNA8L_13690 [Luteolibacter sp.]
MKTAKKSKPYSTGGNLKPAEIRPLIMAARSAYNRQLELGLIDRCDDFNTWRHAQTEAAVGKPGFSACVHADYRPLMAHFKILSGDDAGAFNDLTHTGPAGLTPDDTHEERRIIAHHIAQAIREHQIGGGKIGIGYVVAIARHKTRRPELTLTGDLESALADRCNVAQLAQIRSTIINRINAADGRGHTTDRNVGQTFTH